MDSEYRNLDTKFDEKTGRHIASSQDDDLILTSVSRSRLRKAVDQLWDALRCLDTDPMRLLDIESLPIPGWIRNWLRSDSSRIDIDREFAASRF